jgi:ribosome-associated protein
MTKTTTLTSSAEKLADLIVEGLQEKKGLEITRLDLRGIPQAVCDYFVICTGTSSTHVNGLADSVDGLVKKKSGEDPWHVEGYKQGDWVLMDYINVVVHVFQPEARTFYALEKLWADAPVKHFNG